MFASMLTNEDLIVTYQRAINLELSEGFISLLSEEIKRRKIQFDGITIISNPFIPSKSVQHNRINSL
jgi:hypothetical protein